MIMEDGIKSISRFLGYGWHERKDDEKDIVDQYRSMIQVEPFRSEFSTLKSSCRELVNSVDGKAKLATAVATSVEFYRSFNNDQEELLRWLNWFIEAVDK